MKFWNTKFSITLFQVWAIALLFLCFTAHSLRLVFWFLSDLLILALAIGGMLMFISLYTYKLVKHKTIFRLFLREVLILLGVLVVGCFLFFNSYNFSVYFKLPVYYEIVEGIKANKIDIVDSAYKGVNFETDNTNGQLRVAFPDGAGLIDNWCALIWDPSGFVTESNHFESNWSNWSDENLQVVKKLFGGDLMWVKHKFGPWYLGCFT
jgi:multisubunit Na+/H+ antiporter MnhB subunit